MPSRKENQDAPCLRLPEEDIVKLLHPYASLGLPDTVGKRVTTEEAEGKWKIPEWLLGRLMVRILDGNNWAGQIALGLLKRNTGQSSSRDVSGTDYEKSSNDAGAKNIAREENKATNASLETDGATEVLRRSGKIRSPIEKRTTKDPNDLGIAETSGRVNLSSKADTSTTSDVVKRVDETDDDSFEPPSKIPTELEGRTRACEVGFQPDSFLSDCNSGAEEVGDGIRTQCSGKSWLDGILRIHDNALFEQLVSRCLVKLKTRHNLASMHAALSNPCLESTIMGTAKRESSLGPVVNSFPNLLELTPSSIAPRSHESTDNDPHRIVSGVKAVADIPHPTSLAERLNLTRSMPRRQSSSLSPKASQTTRPKVISGGLDGSAEAGPSIVSNCGSISEKPQGRTTTAKNKKQPSLDELKSKLKNMYASQKPGIILEKKPPRNLVNKVPSLAQSKLAAYREKEKACGPLLQPQKTRSPSSLKRSRTVSPSDSPAPRKRNGGPTEKSILDKQGPVGVPRSKRLKAEGQMDASAGSNTETEEDSAMGTPENIVVPITDPLPPSAEELVCSKEVKTLPSNNMAAKDGMKVSRKSEVTERNERNAVTSIGELKKEESQRKTLFDGKKGVSNEGPKSRLSRRGSETRFTEGNHNAERKDARTKSGAKKILESKNYASTFQNDYPQDLKGLFREEPPHKESVTWKNSEQGVRERNEEKVPIRAKSINAETADLKDASRTAEGENLDRAKKTLGPERNRVSKENMGTIAKFLKGDRSMFEDKHSIQFIIHQEETEAPEGRDDISRVVTTRQFEILSDGTWRRTRRHNFVPRM